MNMRTLPFFDIDKPYFNAMSSDMTSGGYSTYGVAGDASISPSSFSAVYMNKSVLSEAGADVGAIYSSAESGTWTWDEYLTLVESVKSLNESSDKSYYTTTAENTASRLPDLGVQVKRKRLHQRKHKTCSRSGLHPQKHQKDYEQPVHLVQ